MIAERYASRLKSTLEPESAKQRPVLAGGYVVVMERLFEPGSVWNAIGIIETTRGSRYGVRCLGDRAWTWVVPDEVRVLDAGSWRGVDERWHDGGDALDEPLLALLLAGESEDRVRETLFACFPELLPRVTL